MSNRGRYMVEAIVVEHRSPSELARTHKVSRSWIYKMLERFEQGGYASLEPRSRRPRSCSHQVEAKIQKLIIKLRCELAAAGHDAGPHTIHFHLSKKVSEPPSVATIWRILKRHGLVTPQPQKRPKSSFIRFAAKLPNETWQADATPWTLADGSPVEILNFLDDCSRVALASSCFRTVKGHDVAHVFHSASNTYGLPASLLTDNGAVFTGRQRRGKVILELELERLRPHRALNRQTPIAVFNSLIKAKPAGQPAAVDHRVRRDKLDSQGSVTLRYLSKLRHIRVGAAHKNRKVRLLIAGEDVRIITEHGELLRALTLEPHRSYYGLGGRWPVHNVLQQVSTMS